MFDTNDCEYCMFYEYDEEFEEYICTMNLDEDEMSRFMSGYHKKCPYFKNGDEYTIVRKQN